MRLICGVGHGGARRCFAWLAFLFALAAWWLVLDTTPSMAAPILGASFAADYTITSLGTPGSVPGSLGGLTLEASDPNTLLIGGNANGSSGAIYSIGVIRDAQNHITGFSGPATLFASGANIDGGLAYGPGGVLFYTGYPNNVLGEIEPGSTAPNKVVNLNGLVTSSVGTLAFVPAGFPGAGEFKIASYNGGGFYTATLSPDGSGTFNVTSATLQSVPGGGPEGIAYVPPGSPDFSSPSLLLSEYSSGNVVAYTLDANGNPILATGQDFITGLSGAEGAAIDPLTGDFLFSTFGSGNQVLVVQGFSAPASATPEPATFTLLGLGALGMAGCAWKRRRRAAA